LHLPPLPTTTIGSYPQTSAIRKARAGLRAGEIDQTEYVRRMRAEIADVIAVQDRLGLDVLVHGEPERNDVVQYFAEQLDGFFATRTAGCSPTEPVACGHRSSTATWFAATR
jgi:5-methyltetrahydropteroyltriglutamate--homocysteine methyltransferase